MPYSPEMFDYLTQASAPDVRMWFAVTIEGIPYILTTPGTTSLPTVAADRVGYSGATVKDLLKVGHGLDAVREEASRRRGVADTQEITISLGPDSDDFLLELFAYQPSDLVETVITQTVDWSDTTINVLDTDGFSDGDLVHLGKEAITIGTVDAGNSRFTGCTRAERGSHKGLYVQDADLYKGSVNLRSRPSAWEGRVAALWMGIASAEGTAVDLLDPVCVFRGPIASMPVAEDWVTWSFSVRDLTALLDTELGGYKIEGRLLGAQDFCQLGPVAGSGFRCMFVQEGVNDKFAVSMIANFTDGTSTPQAWDEEYVVTLDDGFHADIIDSILTGLESALSGTDFDGEVVVQAGADFNSDDGWTESAKNFFRFALDPTAGFDPAPGRFQVTMRAGDPDSVLPSLGFEIRSHQTVNVVPQTGPGWRTFRAVDWPTLYEYRAGESRLVPVVVPTESKQVVDQTIPASGLLALGGVEVISYDSITDVDVELANVTVFTVDAHNLFDSPSLAYKLQWAWADGWLRLEASGADDDTAKVMWGVGGTPTGDETILDILLKMAISTGGNRYPSGDYSDWDTADIGEHQGAAIPGPYFDTDSFGRFGAVLSEILTKKSLAFAEPQRLWDLFSEELALLGLCLVSKPTSGGETRLSLVDVSSLVNQTLLALSTDTAGAVEVDTTNVAGAVTLTGEDPEDKIKAAHDLGDVINRITIRPLYDVAGERQLDTKAVYNEMDSQIEYGVVKNFDLDAKGWGGNRSRALQACALIGPAILATFAHRRPFYECQCDRRGWALSPGDQVALTADGVPNESGGRGLVNQVATVLLVEKRYFDPAGGAHCRIIAVANTRGRYSYYCPSGQVTSKGTDGTGDYIQIAANTYSEPVVPNVWGLSEPSLVGDILWFVGAAVIRIYTRGAEDVDNEIISVSSVDIANRKIYLASLPALTVGANTVVTYAPYTEALSDSQRQFAYISSNAGILTDDASAESDGNRYL